MKNQAHVPKTAFIGGGGRGIGRSISLALADNGFEVFIVARTFSELNTLNLRLKDEGKFCHVKVVDLTSSKEVSLAIKEAYNIMGSIGVLISCAGAHPKTYPIEDYPIDYWHMMMGVNLNSVFYSAREVVPFMKKQGTGRIINITSIATKIAPPNTVGYVSAKYGVIGLTKVLANELGKYGITVNAISPGFVETKMTEKKEQLRNFCIEQSAIGRVVDADEIVALIIHLVGLSGGAITGQTLNVCGGLYI